MKKNVIYAALALCFALAQLNAQPSRYLDEVFDEVELSTNVDYGTNITVLLTLQGAAPIPRSLPADVYQPIGDTAAQRPLAILAHAGNFIPKTVWQDRLGAKDDSCLVYLAHQLARRGYVVAVMSNRMGWDVFNHDAQMRRFSLANALYRGIQDVNTCVRFFKKNAAAYRIHPEKIMVWGDGSGGILSMSAASLASYEEWRQPQFTMDVPPFEMVQDSINGDVFATSTGIVPPGYPLYTAGDSLCLPNHLGYDSRFQLAVSMGGGLIDTSWIHAGEPPMIAFHGLPNTFMPYDECGSACLPSGLPGNEPVVLACGSYVAIETVLAKGNNAVFEGLQFPGDHSAIANARTGGLDGLFPLTALFDPATNLPNPEPWIWWDEEQAPNSPSAELAKHYLDTMLAYVAPRACLALDLDCAGVTSSVAQPSAATAPAIAFAPNPTDGWVQASLPVSIARTGHIKVFDANGRLLRVFSAAGPVAELDLQGLPGGVYFVSWMVGEAVFQGRVAVR